MDEENRIALATKEHSLIELHEEILRLLEKQPPNSRLFIEQLIDYYNKLILCMPGNVYWMDKNCRTIGCNQNVLDMFGLDNQQQFYNLSFEDMARIGHWSRDQGISFERDTLEVIHSGVPKQNVEEPPIPDIKGNDLYFLSTRVPIYNSDNEVIGIVGISTDISQQRCKASEKANKVKTEFLANLSHDLRTPLASLAVMTEHLSNKIEDPALSKIAYDAQSCAEQVMLLVEEILEVTEIGLGVTSKQDQVFSIEQLIVAIHNLMKYSAMQKSLEFSYAFDKNIPDALIGKRPLLYRILMNLIANAIKFTRHGSVSINASLSEKSDSHVTIKIEVADTGIGIPPDKHEQIFEQFERLTSACEGEYAGRGLGLYIVKQFAEAMSAKISVESQEQVGTKITLLIPLEIAVGDNMKKIVREYQPGQRGIEIKSNAPSDSAFVVETNLASTAKASILLVEDTEIARRAALLVLNSVDCQVDVAVNGADAMRKIKEKRYDLILLDIGLPDISGTELAKKMRDFEANHMRLPTPIIALTAHIRDSGIQQCLNSGIQQVMVKPLSSDRAKALFENWIAKKEPNHSIHVEPSKPIVPEELVEAFLNQLLENSNKLETFFEQKKLVDLKKLVHSINGSASYLPFPHLKNACSTLESAIADDASMDETTQLYASLKAEIRNVLSDHSVSIG